MSNYSGTVFLLREEGETEIQIEFKYSYHYRPQTRWEPEENDIDYSPVDEKYKDLELTDDEIDSLDLAVYEDIERQEDMRESEQDRKYEEYWRDHDGRYNA